MKRFFAFLLMLVLPLQFSFAAASAYCRGMSRASRQGMRGIISTSI
ncbi:MAG: hypothetical protein IPP88_14035 [Betaproteobacteria bacterium]|nr:hypothetical protein [Betaproteobacteria bacterium]